MDGIKNNYFITFSIIFSKINMKKIYAIFGGNFDPIHYGHIYSAENLAQEILITKIILLPNKNPPHRCKSKTPIIDRLKMIKLATTNKKLFEISHLETKGEKIFHTVETLKKIRIKIGFLQPLCFIIGEDNLRNFNQWKNWKEILLYTHLLVCPRINKIKISPDLEKWIFLHSINDPNFLYKNPSGYIFFSKIPIFNISSTKIRNNYYKGKNAYDLVPKDVEKYILLKKLYKKY